MTDKKPKSIENENIEQIKSWTQIKLNDETDLKIWDNAELTFSSANIDIPSGSLVGCYIVDDFTIYKVVGQVGSNHFLIASIEIGESDGNVSLVDFETLEKDYLDKHEFGSYESLIFPPDKHKVIEHFYHFQKIKKQKDIFYDILNARFDEYKKTNHPKAKVNDKCPLSKEGGSLVFGLTYGKHSCCFLTCEKTYENRFDACGKEYRKNRKNR